MLLYYQEVERVGKRQIPSCTSRIGIFVEIGGIVVKLKDPLATFYIKYHAKKYEFLKLSYSGNEDSCLHSTWPELRESGMC